MYEVISAPCLVVGNGAAGLRAAIKCTEHGIVPLIVTKSVIGQSHSLMAEGGMNAALGHKDPTDNWEVHLNDTLESGRYINNPEMAEILCKEAPARVVDLYRFGAGFPVDEKGRIAQTSGPSGAQSRERVVAVGDFIGFVLQRVLMRESLRRGVRFLDEVVVVRIIVDDGRVRGALAYSLKMQGFVYIKTEAIIMASGGAGFLYSRTTNPAETTGDGYVLAYMAGVELRDMEMIQFHPTTLCFPPTATGILVTEAARGIGGRLYNNKGERFMFSYDSRGELAPRDVVARTIVKEVAEGRGGPQGGVFLSLRHLDSEMVKKRLSNTARVLMLHQHIDITKEDFEVAPGAHHVMGGIVPSNVATMETSIKGLFVAGEAAWGTHGANRIGGNALAETQVFGYRAGRGAAQYILSKGIDSTTQVSESEVDFYVSSVMEWLNFSAERGEKSIYQIKKALRDLMFKYAGIIRTETGLKSASQQIEGLRQEFAHAYKPSHYFSLLHTFEVRGMLLLADIVIQSALLRKESRGAHFREDYPFESANLYNTSVIKENDSERPIIRRIALSLG